MSSILNGQGFGHSKDSLKDAIINAISNAMAEAGVNGNHKNSTTVIVDGYEFDGEAFKVKARVSVLDIDLEKEEIYHEKDEELRERLEHSEEINNAFYASAYGFDNGYPADPTGDIDNSMEDILNNDEGIITSDDNAPQDNFLFMASDDVHAQLEREIQPAPRQNLTPTPDSPAPEPGGGGLPADDSDKAA